MPTPALAPLTIPVLTGRRARLRPWRRSDRERLDYDRDLLRFVEPVLPGLDISAFGQFLEHGERAAQQGAGLWWAIADPDGDEVLGMMSLFGLGTAFEHGSGRLGYWLLAPARGRGVLVEALELVAQHAFGSLGLHRLAAETDLRNAASQAGLVRAGFTWVGTEQQSLVYRPRGERFDTVRFERLAETSATRRPLARPTLPAPPVLSGDSLTLSRVRRTDVDEATWVVTQHRQWAGLAHTWAIRRGTTPSAAAVGTVTAYLAEPGSTEPTDALIEPDLPPEHAALAAEATGLVLQLLGGGASGPDALEVPVIDGRGIRLRPWRRTDIDRVTEACADPTTQHFLPDLPRRYGTAEALEFVRAMEATARAGAAVGWCVADLDQDRCLGALTVSDLGQDRVRRQRSVHGEVGYWAHPDARGRGLLTEAVRRAVRHAFVDVDDGGLGLQRLLLRAAATNLPSQAVARSAGFTEVGRDRRADYLGDGRAVDAVRFDLLRTDSGWALPH